jgi:hypothetical protein
LTQASLSPDLSGALGASPSTPAASRTDHTSESSLWVTALTASGLVVAAVLLLGLLSRNVVADASLGGFVSGIAIMIAALGASALAYVLITARRQGLVGSSNAPSEASTHEVPSGMHVVPALPAEMGRRRRLQLEEERSARSRQAKAIASATATPLPARPAARPTATPRPVATEHTPTPRPSVRAAPSTHLRPRSAAVGRPGPRPSPASNVGPAAVRALPARPMPPAIRMPGPWMRQPRPAAWPVRAPVVRMAVPPAMPRTRVAMHQVRAADTRMRVPFTRR